MQTNTNHAIQIESFKTAGYVSKDDYLFNCWRIKNHQDISEKDLDDLVLKAKKEHIDFIVEEKEGTIQFIHISYTSLKENIKNEGLCFYNEPDLTKKWINDLGDGIYVIEEDNEESLDNLKNYIEYHEEPELIIVRGTYTGLYDECIYGLEHEGYICLKNNVPKEDIEIEVMSVSDFLLL